MSNPAKREVDLANWLHDLLASAANDAPHEEGEPPCPEYLETVRRDLIPVLDQAERAALERAAQHYPTICHTAMGYRIECHCDWQSESGDEDYYVLMEKWREHIRALELGTIPDGDNSIETATGDRGARETER